MANLRRRSARLSKANTNQPSARKTPSTSARLYSLVERDETPDAGQESIDEVLATPTTSRTARTRLSELEALKTPSTEPRPEKAEMDPKTAHRSTAKAPDSGLKLGFSDIKKDKTQDTPSKSATRQSIPTSTTFEFKFSSDSHLSRDAQKLMENVRDDAARIKAQMLAERAAQEQKDQAAENMFGAGRKIAQPKGKAGRFSDVHMAQFKKMDSIANHASSFRARPGYTAPTAQSLKRSPSKAGLDEQDRPQTAGKSIPSQLRRIPPPVTGRPVSISPFKTIPAAQSRATPGPSKRARQMEGQDVSDSRPPSSLPRPKPSTLYSPTKSSMARASEETISPEKPSMIPRSNSIKSRKVDEPKIVVPRSPSKPAASKPLPALPSEPIESTYPSLPTSPAKSLSQENRFTSKLPTLSGLKSILRGDRNAPAGTGRPGTPKRPNTGGIGSISPRKVDFTPSVKSRYAVKLAADSPSPAKPRNDTPYKESQPAIPYDSSAWVIQDSAEQEFEDDPGEVSYPTLPLADEEGPVNHTFNAKAKELNRRESKEFKSIFTNLHPSRNNEPATLTSINTMVNKTNPEIHANRVMRSPSNHRTGPSPNSIRRVRGSSATELIQPFQDKAETATRNPAGRKRRYEPAIIENNSSTDDDAKENQRLSAAPAVPGAWDDSTEENDNEVEEEATSRAGKRVRVSIIKPVAEKKPVKKPNAAREAAAKNAKERKGRGVLSLSRLNMLSRPKTRSGA